MRYGFMQPRGGMASQASNIGRASKRGRTRVAPRGNMGGGPKRAFRS